MAEAKITLTVDGVPSAVDGLSKVTVGANQAGDAIAKAGESSKASSQHVTGLTGYLNELAPSTKNVGAAFTDLKGTISEMWENPTAGAKGLAGAIAQDLGPSLGALGIAAGVASGAMVAVGLAEFELAERAAGIGAQLNDMSEKTGIAVPALSNLGGAAQIAGFSLDQVSNAIFMFQRNMAEGGDKFATGLNRIHVSLEELKSETPDQQFLTIASAIKGIEDPSQKAAAAMELFGRQGRDLLPLLSKPLDELVEKSKALGLTWSTEDSKAAEDFEMATKALGLQVQQLSVNVGRELIPQMTQLVSEVGPVITAISYLGTAVAEAGRAMGASGASFQAQMIEMSASREQADAFAASTVAGTTSVKGFSDGIDKYKGSIASLLPTQADEKIALRELEADHRKLVEAQKAAQKAEEEWQQVIAEVSSAGDGWKGTLLGIDGAVVELSTNLLASGVSATTVAKYYGLTATQMKAVEASAKNYTDALKTLSEIHNKIEAGELHINEAMKQVNSTELATTKQWIDDYTARLKAQRGFDDEMARVTLTSNDFKKRAILQELSDQKAALEKMGGNWTEAYDTYVETARLKLSEIGTFWDDATNSWVETFDQNWAKGGVEHSMKAVDDITKGAKAHTQEWSEAVRGLGGELSRIAGIDLGPLTEQMAQIFKAQSSGATGPGIGGSNVSKSQMGWAALGAGANIVAQQIDTGPGASTSNLVGAGALQGAAAGAPYAGATYGISVGVGAAAGAIAGWIQSGKEWRKVVNDISRDMGGIKVSEDFAKMIDQLEDDTGLQRVQAITTQLDQLIGMAGGLDNAFAGGKNNNFDLFFGKLHDAFSYIEQGSMTTAQVTQLMDKNFADFAAAGTDSLGRVSDKIKELIDLDQRFGTQSKEVEQFIQQQATSAGAGFNAVVAGTADAVKGYDALKKAVDDARQAEVLARQNGDSGEAQRQALALVAASRAQGAAAADAKQELSDLGVQAVASFAAAVASGVSVDDELKALGPSLTTLQQSYTDLGLNVDDVALKNLFMQSTVAQGNPGLLSAIGGLSKEMVSLDNIGLMNVDTFDSMERTGMAMYTRLQGQVASVGGTTKDALVPMQSYLHEAADEAKALGVPLDANTQMLIDQSKDLGVWKDAGKSATDILTASMTSLVDKVKELIDKLSGVPASIPAPWKDWGPPPPMPGSGGDGSADGAATGGLVTAFGIQHFASGGFVGGPRGTDTVPAWLTEGEVVLNKGQQQSVFGGNASLIQALRADNAALHAVVAKLGDKIERMMNAQPMFIAHAMRMVR